MITVGSPTGSTAETLDQPPEIRDEALGRRSLMPLTVKQLPTSLPVRVFFFGKAWQKLIFQRASEAKQNPKLIPVRSSGGLEIHFHDQKNNQKGKTSLCLKRRERERERKTRCHRMNTKWSRSESRAWGRARSCSGACIPRRTSRDRRSRRSPWPLRSSG